MSPILRGSGSCIVSMKSGLEGRNNRAVSCTHVDVSLMVSMKSGLEGRNNPAP